jgi:hypothetical protein
MMKITRLVLFACFVLGTVSLLFGQVDENLQAKVPFNFYAGDKMMPAGNYDIKTPSGLGEPTLLIRNDETGRPSEFLVDTDVTERQTAAPDSQLVFTKVGDKYFLSQLWVVGENTGVQFSKSKAELQAQRDGQSKEQVNIHCRRQSES